MSDYYKITRLTFPIFVPAILSSILLVFSESPEAIGTASEPESLRGRPRLRFGPKLFPIGNEEAEDAAGGGEDKLRFPRGDEDTDDESSE